MFGFLKKLFGGQKTKGVESQQIRQPQPQQSNKSIVQQEIVSESKPSEQQAVKAEELLIPLRSIIARLPEKLKGSVKKNPSSEVFARFSMSRILPQLKNGAIKVSFGELKKASPEGIFYDNLSSDSENIELPLNEIIPRINKEVFVLRSRVQAKVPDYIPQIFTRTGSKQTQIDIKGIKKRTEAESVEPIKPEEKKTEQLVEPVSEEHKVIKVEEPQYAVSEKREQADKILIKLSDLCSNWQKEIREEIERLNLLNVYVGIPEEDLLLKLRGGRVIYSLGQIFDWAQNKTTISGAFRETQVELPLKVVVPLCIEKFGQFKTKKSVVIDQDLPMLFRKVSSKEVPIAEVAKPAEPVGVEPVGEPSSMSTVVDKGRIEEPAVKSYAEKVTETEQVKKESPGLDKLLGVPGKTIWTPNEVVQKLAQFTEVLGAMIVFKNGLIVAAQLPAEIDGEAIASRVPELYEPINKTVNELKMGEASSVIVYLDQTPVLICKGSNIYLVVFGRKGNVLSSIETYQAITSGLVKMGRH